ncbi:hypothetical protein GPECTOR_10g1004 [Gonium pectorale]|uniref:Uncharacterized protein n=1 Tax=Gonium pectorale TaxID=33097 RepID=A0A150GQG9_GONPE|nr:hypothetical protein GPECTOR_10g1004 [Gonium pectorale]|eukprot:KXZ51982.1 hypothetical protein GPECTOR_10g1004 [Gonium pectorale]
MVVVALLYHGVDLTDAELAAALEAWQTWIDTVDASKYFAAAHALVQDILSAVPVAGEHTIQPGILDVAWREDAAGAPSCPPERFSSSLAALATVCCSDGSPKAAASCLTSLLEQLRGQSERWQGLLELYSNAGLQAAASAASSAPAFDAVDGGSEQPDVVPASDKSPTAPKARGDDDASSLGLSRASSTASAAEPTVSGADVEAASAAVPRARGHQSTKSLGDPDLARKLSQALSGASSADLGDLPDNLEALERQPLTDTRKNKAAKPNIFASTMASEEGRGNLADMPMDLKQWATFKDHNKQATGAGGRPPVGPAVPRGARPGAGTAPLIPLNGAGGKVADPQGKAPEAAAPPPLLHARMDGPKANPLHNAIVNSSAVRQSVDREQAAQQSRVSRLSSNASLDTPTRQRSLAAGRRIDLSRKPSISEPGPTGPQAEWKHLPALGQASKLHPQELRQLSHGQLRPDMGGTQAGGPKTISPTTSAAAYVDDKLPSLPSLAGARGQPPKATEMHRRPSIINRSDVSRSDNHAAGNAHLPGLGLGDKKAGPGGRQLRMPSKKKSFRGDRDF